VILTAGVFFHLGTLLFMNIFFPFHLAMYLVFIDWPAVARRLGRVKLFQRIVGVSEGLAVVDVDVKESEGQVKPDNN
jgi:membrane protein implicated in regulation of membrane protease activity